MTNVVNLVATNDVAGEQRFRSMANLVTTRGNVFTIWAIAQTLQEVPGATNVVGEAKAQMVVQRTQNPGADGVYGTGDDTVSYQRLYFRYYGE